MKRLIQYLIAALLTKRHYIEVVVVEHKFPVKFYQFYSEILSNFERTK